MKILTLCHEAPPLGGGGGAAAIGQARAIAREGHDVDFVTMGFEDLPELETADGVRVIRIPCRRRRKELSTSLEKILWVRGAIPRVMRLMSEVRYDIVHCHFAVPAGVVALQLCGDTPYVITCHGSDVPKYNPHAYHFQHVLIRPWWRRIMTQAGAITSPSNSLIELIGAALNGTGPNVVRIPYGFKAGRFDRSRREERVLLVSRLVERKGFQHFLKAISDVDLGYEVDVVGDGPYRKALEEIAQETPTPVKFWGWVDNDSPQLRELFERASIFVLPSSSENFPVALMEGMDAGLAVITSNTTGCPEVVGDTGLLVPPESPEAIREAVLSLTRTPTRIESMGDAARRRVRENFDWPVVTRQFMDLYMDVAGVHQE